MIVAVMTTAFAGTVKADPTYKLEQVTSVEAGGLYVFEQGGYVMINTISSNNALQTTNTYNTTGLTGTETYVWTLETGTNGFYLKNKSLESTVANGLWYLKNGSSTSVSFDGKTSSSLWRFSFTEGIALIQNTNNRFLGWTSASSHEYRAYAASNLNNGSYPHAITVYQLVEEGGSTPLADSDLALTGAPVALNFDLYNNAEPQTISYITSSTGAVTVSSSDYVNCEVNETTKTITVTPTAVTPSAQTITVSQAADDNYKAGTAIFTITVDDSTPFTGAMFDATKDKGTSPITKDNVSFACSSGVLDNGSEYRLYKNSTTTISTTDGSHITKIEFTCTSGNPATGFGSQTGWSTTDNGGVWTGEAESVSFVASGAQVRATLIKVWVKPNTNPSLAADNVNIACNAVEGAITYTLTNPATNGALTASTTSDWLTIGTVGETISFTCEANTTATARTANVTITYTYGDSQSVTKEVVVTQEGKKDAGLAYATTSVTKFEGDANFTNTLTNPNSLNVTYASSEESVATIDNNGEVTILAAGTTTITASYSGDEIYLSGSANYTLTVNEPFVAEDGVFDFVEAAGQGYDYGSGVPIAHGANGNYIYEDKTWTAGNVTLVSSGKYRWWYNGYELRFYKTDGDNEATKESAMTISVPEGKVITSIEVFGGKNWETDCGSYSDGKWTGSSQTVVFTYSGTNSNNVTKVVVTYSETESVSVGDLKYSTYASDNALDFTGSSIKAFYPTVDGSTLIFHEITKVRAGTGVLLYSANGAVTEDILVCTGETDAVENNAFVRGTGASVTYNDATQEYIYVLSKPQGDNLGFYKANNNRVATNRAYIKVPAELSGAKSFTINLEDDPTGIVNFNDNVNANEGAIYNLAGQRLSKMQKGINIINGKKVLK
jgi:hypothetical protein